MLQATIHSSIKLPRKIIFGHDPHEDSCKTVLESLGVVFYRDERTPKLVIVGEPELGIELFETRLILDERSWVVDEWSEATMKKVARDFEDSLAITRHNLPVKLIGYTPSTLTTETT
jgi:hypothetical protein